MCLQEQVEELCLQMQGDWTTTVGCLPFKVQYQRKLTYKVGALPFAVCTTTAAANESL